MKVSDTLLSRPLGEIMNTTLLCVYEGWAIERLSDFFNRHGIHTAPVIASDHQLVGAVSNGDIYRFLHSDETLRARAVNQHYRRLTGSDMDNLDELTRWTHRAHHYCTVHQIMQTAVPQLTEDCQLKEAIALLRDCQVNELFVTRGQVLTGRLDAKQILTLLFEPD